MSETPFESPVEDLAEQQAAVVRDDDSGDRLGSGADVDELAWDADPVDAQEQDAEVPIDEDEWR